MTSLLGLRRSMRPLKLSSNRPNLLRPLSRADRSLVEKLWSEAPLAIDYSAEHAPIILQCHLWIVKCAPLNNW